MIGTLTKVMREYGEAVRGDWSELDGRSVRSVLDGFADELEGKLEPCTMDERRERLGLCPDGGGHWGGRWGHCDTYECPTYTQEQEASK